MQGLNITFVAIGHFYNNYGKCIFEAAARLLLVAPIECFSSFDNIHVIIIIIERTFIVIYIMYYVFLINSSIGCILSKQTHLVYI